MPRNRSPIANFILLNAFSMFACYGSATKALLKCNQHRRREINISGITEEFDNDSLRHAAFQSHLLENSNRELLFSKLMYDRRDDEVSNVTLTFSLSDSRD
jgi:hypothetical protein